METTLTKMLMIILLLPPLALYFTYRHLYHEDISSPVEELEPWESPIIHIINTRFMQDQGNLTTLATARLHLFKTICLPSILHQTYHDFLWIIKIDPDLNIDIRNELISSIHQAVEILLLESERRNIHATYGVHDSYIGSVDSLRERIFVIGSNQNFLIGHEHGAWRGGTESAEVLSHHAENRIYIGNVDLLKMAKKAEPDKIVLETRLDADDGLNEGYIAYLHHDSMKKFHGITGGEEKEMAKSINFKWFYWCVETHFKWYVSAEGEYGQLRGEKRKDFCITPGLTVGFNVGTSVEDVPMYGHHELVRKLSGNNLCMEKVTGTNESGKGGEDENKTEKVPCVDVVSGFIGAVRSRTATSAGMDDVKGQNVKQNSEELWDVLEDRFDVMVEDAIETKRYFEENMEQIAKENLEGQCRPGHSCKESSQNKLKQIIEESEQGAKV
jgi:hypothetical protein